MAHININSLRNKFDILTNSVSEYIDVVMISETKLDHTCPHALYHLKNFSNPSRLDRNSHGSGILVYIRDNIPCNLVKFDQKFENLKVSLLNWNCRRKTNGWLVIPIIHRKATQNNTYAISVKA